MEKILKKESFPAWIEKLTSYTLYAPVTRDGLCNYEVLDDHETVELNHLNTLLPPKTIIFPPRETYFEFCHSPGETPDIRETLPEEKETVIFGVRPCDAKALTLTDKVFGGEFNDVYYWKRRNQTVLVGLACNTPPSPHCFCLSVHCSPYSKEGLDILLTDLGDRYYVESLTEKADHLISTAQEIFREPEEKDREDVQAIHLDSEKKIERHIKNSKSIPSDLAEKFESSLWDEESMSCIRCGICTYLCPTCHCFDINDEVTSSHPLKGKRVRTWDTCQFPRFTMHSSGHNPRPDKASRLRQRIMHKFMYSVEYYGSFLCTGCGRCIAKCPVGIDILEVINRVSGHES